MAKEATRKKMAFISHASDLYGAPRSLLLLLEQIDLERYSPFLVCSSNGPLVDRTRALGIPVYVIPTDYPCRRYEKASMFRSIPLRFTTLVRAEYIFKLALFLRYHRPDLVYVNTIAHVAPIIAARMLRIPILAHVRESGKYLACHGIMGRLRLRAILSFPDRFICVSKAVRELLSARGVPFDKMSVVYNGVDLDKFRLSEERRLKYRNIIGIDDGDVLVGLVGQIIPRKGVDDFIRAAKLVHEVDKRCHFVIIGGIMDRPFFESKVLALVHTHNLRDCVTFTGFRRDMVGYFSAIDIIVNVSKEEPFARVNLEAMAMEKPVVANNTGGNPEAVVDGETGYLVPVGNTGILARAILELVRSNGLRNRFGKAGRARVERHFTSDHYYRGVQAVLNNMGI